MKIYCIHMKPLNILLAVVLGFATMAGCQQDRLEPTRNDGIPPGKVIHAEAEPGHGVVTITYTPPTDRDLLYVKAVYRTKKGEVRETKATFYTNKITVTGFADTSFYDVDLYAVDEGENLSEPYTIRVKPLKPPYLIVRDSIKAIADFGGLNVSFVNELKENIAIITLGNDSLGNFVPVNTFYTNVERGNFSTRGFPAEPTTFGICIRDRWNNLSDTLLFELTPYFEVRLDKTRIRPLVLPNDAPLGYGGEVRYLFDDVFGNNGWYHTSDQSRMPQWFTFDMGMKAKLSRLVWRMRDGQFYNLHNPRTVEIWGSNNPSPDGSWDNWVLLKAHEQIKPSGLPPGQLSQADEEAGIAGETVTFSLEVPEVRYIRFKTLRNWSNGTYVNFNEITLFGSPEQTSN
jgi:F5/8 type C domain.